MSSYIAHSSSVQEEEMKPFIKAFNTGNTLDSMRRNDTITSKNVSFFQFWGHNVPMNCSKLLGVKMKSSP